MKIIKQLNKLPINSGEYLVLPSLETPYFVIPLHSRRIFLGSIRLIKPKNRKGLIKKILVQFIPLFILKKFFPIITVSSKNLDVDSFQLVLPWNQDFSNKFTIFNIHVNNITLLKIAFGAYRDMIRNEYKVLSGFSGNEKNMIPELVSFSEEKEYTYLETDFYDGIHPEFLPSSIVNFLNNIKEQSRSVKMINHPYITSIINNITTVLEKENLNVLLNQITKFMREYEHELVPVVVMHGDCSRTNIISTPLRSILVDWEDCISEGIPIDEKYFDFRRCMDNGKSWLLNDMNDFLVVLHYVHLQIKHGNIEILRKLKWVDSKISK